MTLDELDTAFNAGLIHENTFVMEVNGTEWQTLADVAGLNDEEEPAPPRRRPTRLSPRGSRARCRSLPRRGQPMASGDVRGNERERLAACSFCDPGLRAAPGTAPCLTTSDRRALLRWFTTCPISI